MGGRKPAKERGVRYPVGYVASELGIDVSMLVRELTKAEIDTSEGIKFSEAYTALSGKIEAEKSRRRRQDAEVENAEIDLAHKRGLFAYIEDCIARLRDYATKVRVFIEGCRWLSKEDRKRLLDGLKEIKPELPNPSNKK